MINALILYGSRARRDQDRFSDTDILGVSGSGKIEKPYDSPGLSLHIYPEDWLINEAKSGSLFLLHIVTEAIAIFDPMQKLEHLRAQFRYSDSYRTDGEIGLRVVSAILDLDENEFTPTMRRRYFWGLRTALMAYAADNRSPAFSAKALEAAVDVSELSLHIQTRMNASLSECQRFGSRVMERLNLFKIPTDPAERERNLQFLFNLGGVGTATAAEIIYSFKPSIGRS